MLQKSPQHPLDGRGDMFGLDVAMDLAREAGVDAATAADQYGVTLDGVALVRARHLAGDETDVADIVLGAGVVAAGEVDVDRPVERNARLAPRRDLLGVPLGVGGRELAADIAGAGDEAGADRGRLGG